jgi:O-methyltransferase involved in polyketide biosynthesis
MNDLDIDVFNISGQSETLFFPLYSRAIESQKIDSDLNDKKSVEIVKSLDRVFSKSNSKFHKKLLNHKIPAKYMVKAISRTKKFDEYVSGFLLKHPDGIVVNMGCGLDTRFHRIGNGKVEWYDIDLPPVIELKKHFLNETDHYHFISSSLTNHNWMDLLLGNERKSFLFVAQGVFPYLPDDEVKSLVLELQKKFSGCELLFNVISSRQKERLNTITNKAYYQYFLKMKDVRFYFGISKADELSSWNAGIELINQCRTCDSNTKKINEWIVYYKLIS